MQNHVLISREKYKNFVDRLGENSNSDLTLYSGYQYFSLAHPSKDGALAFVETKFGLVGAAEPLATKDDDLAYILTKFIDFGKKLKKPVLCLPVSEKISSIAKKVGFATVQIGSEPVFNLNQASVKQIFSAKQLHARGARVVEIKNTELTLELKKEMQAILFEWLQTRKTTALSFLNRVEPESLMNEKKYFFLSLKEEILAYLCAVPYSKQKGWYLIDIIKKTGTPVGTIELLVLETMRLLKSYGATEVSLGVSPLANTKQKCLNLIFEKGNVFYNFKKLYEFKIKFQPSMWKPVYLIYFPPKLSLKVFLSLFYVFFPRGVLSFLTSFITHAFKNFEYHAWLISFLKKSIVVRSKPQNGLRFLYRCKASFILLLGYWISYFFKFELNAFNYSPLFKNIWQHVVFSTFLHWNFYQFLINTVLFLLFGFSLEYLVGSLFFIVSFFTALIIADPITAFLFIDTIKEMVDLPVTSVDFFGVFFDGVFGSMGAVFYLFKKGHMFFIFIVLMCCIIAFIEKNTFFLSHASALSIGYWVSFIWFKSKDL